MGTEVLIASTALIKAQEDFKMTTDTTHSLLDHAASPATDTGNLSQSVFSEPQKFLKVLKRDYNDIAS